MNNIDALENKLKALEKKAAPAPRLWVIDVDEGRYTSDGTNYTREQFEALVGDDDTVIRFFHDDDWKA